MVVIWSQLGGHNEGEYVCQKYIVKVLFHPKIKSKKMINYILLNKNINTFFYRHFKHFFSLAFAVVCCTTTYRDIYQNNVKWFVHILLSDLPRIKKIFLPDYIQPICLPDPGAQIEEGRKCFIAGWGLLSENGQIYTFVHSIPGFFFSSFRFELIIFWMVMYKLFVFDLQAT